MWKYEEATGERTFFNESVVPNYLNTLNLVKLLSKCLQIEKFDKSSDERLKCLF